MRSNARDTFVPTSTGPSRDAMTREPIAITGIGCRYPGKANSAESYWNLVRGGVNAVAEVPADRWNVGAYYHPDREALMRSYAKWAGCLDRVDQFEPERFGISPREAHYMDPQQRLLLEAAWEALEDAGQVIGKVAGSNTGVFVGISSWDYSQIQSVPGDRELADAHAATGGSLSIAAARISYCFDFVGPAMSIDTACSSSLVAAHLACRSLWNGECGMALAGGVNVIIVPETFMAFCAASMLSPDGRCKAFDASADGFVRGEGVGVVTLKRLSDAVAAGDPIYAVILASGVNQDGRTNGITVPNPEAQARLLRDVYASAGVRPVDIGYLEAHGTGTAVGDLMEGGAIGQVMSDRPAGDDCPIGSVKTNIGHLEAGAGMASLIKVALMLRHGLIPPSLNFKEPNPKIPFDDLRLRVQTELGPFPARSGVRLAGVNAFGFGGTNAHTLLSEPPARRGQAPVTAPAGRRLLLPLSARTGDGLKLAARAYRDFLTQHPDMSLGDICHTAATRRDHFEQRLTVSGADTAALVEQLDAFSADESRVGLCVGKRRHTPPGKLGFVFAGQGPQWWAMGRQLLEQDPVFREKMVHCDELMRPLSGWSLLEELGREESASRIQETEITQPSIFALQVSLAHRLQAWGVEPDLVVGHSVGEVAAAHVAGALDLEQACKVIIERGRTMGHVPPGGAMLAVGLSAEAIAERIAGNPDIEVSAINSPKSVTLSGTPAALQPLAAALEAEDVFARMLQVSHAFHSRQMEPVREALLRALSGLTPAGTRLPLISTVTGAVIAGTDLTADYWWRNVRQKVNFASAMGAMADNACTVLVEISPHPVLTRSMKECYDARDTVVDIIPTLRRKESEGAALSGTLGSLHLIGYPLDWTRVNGSGTCVHLPGYPWVRDTYWHESPTIREHRLNPEPHPLLRQVHRGPSVSWEPTLDTHVLTWMKDHRVQHQQVFPAAGYIEMALAAAREAFGEGPCVVEGIDILKALHLPEDGIPPRLRISMSPEDRTFAVHTAVSEAADEWTRNFSATYSSAKPAEPAAPFDPAAFQARADIHLTHDQCYWLLARVGLEYGPAFRGMVDLWKAGGETLGRICATEAIRSELDAYIFHPGLLDACFHVMVAAPPAEPLQPGHNPVFIPVHIGRISLLRKPPDQLWAHARLTGRTGRSLEVGLRIYDDSGRLVADISRLKCVAVEGVRDGDKDELDDWTYDVEWREHPIAGVRVRPRSATFIPPLAEAVRDLSAESNRAAADTRIEEQYAGVAPKLNALALSYLCQAFDPMGLQDVAVAGDGIGKLADALPVAAPHRQAAGHFLSCLRAAGRLSRRKGKWALAPTDHGQDVSSLFAEALWKHPAFVAELLLLARSGCCLEALLRGRKDVLENLFPGGSTTLMEHFYQDSASFRRGNSLVAAAVRDLLRWFPKDRTVRVIELGAGTGGLTHHVLPAFRGHRCEYIFTDVSNLFLLKAEPRFRHYPFVTYRTLDLEQDPAAQGFEPHSVDIVLASDVLHATTDIRQSLRRVRSLLSDGGALLFLEVVGAPLWVDVVFGLTPGWWKFGDSELRPDHALMTVAKWKAALRAEGFPDIVSVPREDPPSGSADQVVVVARPQLPEPAPAVAAVAPGQANVLEGDWLIFADEQGVARDLALRMAAAGGTVTQVVKADAFGRLEDRRFGFDPRDAEGCRQRAAVELFPAGKAWRGIVYLWGLDAPPPERLESDPAVLSADASCVGLMRLVQYLWEADPAEPPRLFVVTRGVHSLLGAGGDVSLMQASLHGAAMVVVNEHPQLRTKIIDLSVDSPAEEIDALVAELWTDNAEDEVALRGDYRFAPRLVRKPLEATAPADEVPVGEDPVAHRLMVPRSRVFHHLKFVETARTPPGPGQIEIQVRAASMNFRDVLKVLGMYPTDTDDCILLGDECAGTVSAVGEGVTDFRVGDEVVASAPASFGSYTRTAAAFAFHKPARLNFEEAATLPVAFLTAYYCLHQVGHVEAGERVLIHAATGGVGLAALQIALAAGSDVLATASEEKRLLLRCLGVRQVMDSRALDFADEVMEATDGKGVDIVLNSLAGEALAKGLACLGAHGRFIEIGKMDIYRNTRLGLRPFFNNISFHAVDLSRVMLDKPALAQRLLRECESYLNEGVFNPLPHRVFSASRIAEAFQYMAQAKHVGKIVVSLNDRELCVVPTPPGDLKFPAEATYLITGGFGGFGLILARWMVQQGARHLVLVSRSGAATAEAQQAVQELEGLGATVLAAKADVADREQMAAVLRETRERLPALKGVLHAAVVLDDRSVLQQNEDTFRNVMGPKVVGAWNLHELTRDLPLDFFVLFSSVTTLLGNAGQANYVAANVFLESLVHYRRARGLTGTAVCWGLLGEVGVAARNAKVMEMAIASGLKPLTAEMAAESMKWVLLRKPERVGVFRIDWRQWAETVGSAGLRPRFGELVDESFLQDGQENEKGWMREKIMRAPADERAGKTMDYIREQVARVLGTSPQKLDPDQPLNSLGLDSLMAVELRNRVENDMAVSLPTSEMSKEPNLKRLTDVIMSQLTGGAKPRPGKPAAAAVSPAP